MKLVRLYSNRKVEFPKIPFHPGLNVILAQVRVGDDHDKDDHNLGKTLLSDLLDFMLLKEVDKHFFSRKHSERFERFVFFLEIELSTLGKNLTIRRACATDTKIALKTHTPMSGDADLVDLDNSQWDHANIPIRKAQSILDSHLAFNVAKGWSYRKSASYFLRTQHDYRDPFRVEKFQRSRDIEWKPYVADLLGLPGDLILKKYNIDHATEGGEAAAQLLEKSSTIKEEDYDRVKAQIERKETDLRQRTVNLDSFSFHEAEMEISEDLVTQVESRLGKVEQDIYYSTRDLQTGKEGLARPLAFSTKEVTSIYRDCQIALPESLVRSYEELENFNRSLAKERNRYLRRRIASLEAELSKLKDEHAALSEQRQRYMKVLKNKETFERFKRLQLESLRMEEELRELQHQLERLDEISNLRKKARESAREGENIADELKKVIHHPPARYESIRARFQSILNECLKVPAVLYIRQNSEGNLEFAADIESIAGSGKLTSEAEGSTYQKFLCMAFDLAILAEYSKNHFFHFVYHDGAFEGSDDRKKLKLLSLVKRYCDEFGIQYIMSAIQHELPREASGVVDLSTYVIRELHDDGDEGRLFRMPHF